MIIEIELRKKNKTGLNVVETFTFEVQHDNYALRLVNYGRWAKTGESLESWFASELNANNDVERHEIDIPVAVIEEVTAKYIQHIKQNLVIR